MKDETLLVATPSQTVGPFFHKGLPPQSTGAPAADRIQLNLTVTDGDGQPVDDAVVEVWTNGPAFARATTHEGGACTFDIARPFSPERSQAAHVNVCLFARGLLRQVHTRIYFEGDPALEEDSVLALVPHHRRNTLIARRDPHDPGRWHFAVRLQGPHETVFVDI